MGIADTPTPAFHVTSGVEFEMRLRLTKGTTKARQLFMKEREHNACAWIELGQCLQSCRTRMESGVFAIQDDVFRSRCLKVLSIGTRFD